MRALTGQRVLLFTEHPIIGRQLGHMHHSFHEERIKKNE